MTNYIESSRKIDRGLKGQKVTFKVDEHAPKVWKRKPPPIPPPDYGEGLSEYPYYVGSAEISVGDEFVCPYYGPGGSDNCMKALRALEKKTIASSIDIKGSAWKTIYWHFNALHHTYGQGETDGEALHDLLLKLVGENNG